MGCTQSRDAIDTTVMLPSDCTQTQTQPPPLVQTSTKATTTTRPPPVSGSGHRDVFSIFGEQGMVVDTHENDASSESPSYGARLCSPFSASGSVFSTATTASDIERTHIIHGPTDQCVPALHISYGSYSDKGMRKQNEDREVCTSEVIHDETIAYFGVYDGHGGTKVADFLAENLHTAVFASLKNTTHMARALENAFAETDDTIFQKQMESGSTALSLVVRGREAIVACVGDSQAVLSTNGKARGLSVVHSPDAEGEKERILAAKGVVTKGRIFGLLSVSRAFGDNDFKTSRGEYKAKFKGDLVTAAPDFMNFTIDREDEFLVLGCDGLFEVMEPQQVVDFVRAKLALHGEVQHACEELVSYAISIGSTDNVSAVVVCFNQHATADREHEPRPHVSAR